MSSPTGSSAGSQSISGHSLKSIPNFTPQMMKLFESLLGGVGGGANAGLGHLSKLASGDESAFQEMEAPAYASFNKTLGTIGSRFSQYGAQDSSAFQNAVSGAGGDLAQQLQGQRSQVQTDAISKLLGFSNQLLGQKPYENVLQKDSGGIDFGQILSQALPALLALL
jgi:hypothetical protein